MKKIAVLTSGGDAPGMNACIRSVIRACAHYNLEVFGIHRGYQGLIENEIHQMTSSSVANIIQMGGTILKTARSMDFMNPEGRKKAHQNLVNLGIEGIVCIGGNGTYTGAMIFEKEFGIPSMGCPGTIDNDLWGTDATIGYDTAINTAMEAIDKIRDTADAHNRIFFVEVMGRHSGHIALLSGIAGGAEGIFIPERGNEFDDIVHLYESKARKKEFSIFVVAEGDEEGRAYEISKRFQAIYPETDCRVTVLGHVQRGGRPTANDRILASRLGAHAVKALIDGRKNEAVGVVNNDIKFTSFQEAIEHKKDIQNNLWILNTIITR
ncbi:MAG: 6-phosphofructokinase [Bacteroidetes bacterium]|nr:6-phosphofructokinase [Bacteroidota bacterium]MDA1224136.1 6-phosphofructokinase [Bacteroidota bacterium]